MPPPKSHEGFVSHLGCPCQGLANREGGIPTRCTCNSANLVSFLLPEQQLKRWVFTPVSTPISVASRCVFPFQIIWCDQKVSTTLNALARGFTNGEGTINKAPPLWCKPCDFPSARTAINLATRSALYKRQLWSICPCQTQKKFEDSGCALSSTPILDSPFRFEQRTDKKPS